VTTAVEVGQLLGGTNDRGNWAVPCPLCGKPTVIIDYDGSFKVIGGGPDDSECQCSLYNVREAIRRTIDEAERQYAERAASEQAEHQGERTDETDEQRAERLEAQWRAERRNFERNEEARRRANQPRRNRPGPERQRQRTKPNGPEPPPPGSEADYGATTSGPKRQRAEHAAKSKAEREGNGHEPPPQSEADYGARPPHADLDPRSLTSNGENIACVIDILRNHPLWRDVLAYDRFSLHVMLMKPLPRTGPQASAGQWEIRAMRDVDTTNALAWFHQLGMIKLKLGNLHSAMSAVAQDNAFHPVFTWFSRICAGAAPPEISSSINKADPKLPRATPLDLWLTLGFGAKDSMLTRAIARRFLIALVRRVRRPGTQQDYMLVLFSGEQGVRKSTGLRTLVGDNWFADGMPDIASKDAALQLHGKILVERGEVELLTRRDKAFISRTVDRFRPPYGRSAQDVPRTCSIAGTTNFATFIDDPSGGRRYWPVEAGRGDREWLAKNRDLIWRLACEAEAGGEAAWLDNADMQRAVRCRQDDAQSASSWEEAVIAAAKKSGPGFTVNINFISRALGIDNDRVDPKKHDQAFTAILQRNGWRRGKGRNRYKWFPVNQLPFDADDDG
jgi:predicted P-loop ATPase